MVDAFYRSSDADGVVTFGDGSPFWPASGVPKAFTSDGGRILPGK